MKLENAKQLLAERQALKDRENDYFRKAEEAMAEMGSKTGIITDSIDRNGKLVKLKGFKDRIETDRAKIMSRFVII